MLEPKCPKCESRMTSGFIVDTTYVAAAEGAGGEPHQSMWTGVRMKGRERHPVTTFRCPKCGFLESYAPAGERSKAEAPRKA